MKQNTLKETIGTKTLFFITVNSILGTGIFFLPAIGALHAGPASIVSWLVMSFFAILISSYFAELISMFPKSGGVYEYTKNAFGEFASFIFGWTAWIVANVTIAMLIVGSLRYLFPGQGILFNIGFSIFFIVLFNLISYRGIDVSSKLLLVFGALTLLTIFALLIPGSFIIDIANLDPFFIYPLSSIVLATYFISETFFGWETVGYLSEEVKNARKVIPKMLVRTTIIISVVSILLVFVAITSVGWERFAQQEAPLAFLAGEYFGPNFAQIFALIVFIPLVGTAASWIVSSPRLLYAMSRDNVLLPSFKKVHTKYNTPQNAILFQTIVSSIVTIIALGDFLLILYLLIPLVVFMYSGVMLSVVKLRFSHPNARRYFNAPFPKIGPIVMVLFMMVLLYTWLTGVTNAPSILFFGIVFILLGAPMYILIKIQTDEKFTEKFFDSISGVWDRLFPIWYGQGDVDKVVNRLKINDKSVVLDFGCGSGITTIAIAKKSKSSCWC